MNTTKALLTTFLVLGSLAIHATEQICTSQIEQVTVYPQGVLMSRTTSVPVKAGLNELKISLLSPNLEQKTLQVGIDNAQMTLQNVNYDAEIPDHNKVSQEVSQLNKKAGELRDSIDLLLAHQNVLESEKNLITSTNNIGGNNGVSATQLQSVANFLRKDLNEVARLKLQNEKKINELQKKLTLLNQSISLLYDKQTEAMSCVHLTINSPISGTAKINLRYFVKDAGWTPFYEVRIGSTNELLTLKQKANVKQQIKEEWKEVILGLSLANPTVSNEKPEMNIYTLPNYCSWQSLRIHDNEEEDNAYIKVMGIVRDDRQPLQGALVSCGEKNTQTDENGYYSLLVPRTGAVSYKYAGYHNLTRDVEGKNMMVCNVKMSQNKSEIYSESKAANEAAKAPAYYKTNNLQLKAMAIGTAGNEDNSFDRAEAENEGIATTEIKAKVEMPIRNYTANIEGKSSIPSDGADHEVLIANRELKADYSYYAVPKLSSDVYLVADVMNWRQYDLQSGNVRLYLKNTYMGQSYLDAEQTDDTLHFSVGVDKDLAVERKLVKSSATQNLMHTNETTEKRWQITIKNNKKTSAKVKVDDQYPVSRSSDIKVELLDNGGATATTGEGKLTWNIELAPGEKKVLNFGYSVKYPKDKSIVVE